MENNTNQKIAILCDSCGDISKEMQTKYNIFVLPVTINFSFGQFRDGVDITSEEVYTHLKTEIPKTSLPLGEDIENIFNTIINQGYTHLIIVTIASVLSGTYNLLKLTSQKYSTLQTTIIDSKRASVPQGSLAILGAMQIAEGKNIDQVIATMQNSMQTNNIFFHVNNLEYLQKGGRLSKTTAMAGNMLNIKPILSFKEDGEIYAISKVRGSKQVFSKLLETAQEYYNQHFSPNKKFNLFVAHSKSYEKFNTLKELAIKQFPNYQNLLTLNICPALCVHFGEDVIAIGFHFYD